MNNPFYYTPSPECLQAVGELADWLNGKPSAFCDHAVAEDFLHEIGKGKMFGVLVVEPTTDPTKTRYLAAYSGQVCGRSDWEEFVPAVFDYLQPDGYFKRHEAEITDINRQIECLDSDEAQSVVMDANRQECQDPRPLADKTRHDGETAEEYVRRRQFENAELHRWKVRERERQAAADAVKRQKEEKIASLRTLRRQKSDDLQRWLFQHFVMRNGRGEERDLIDVFDQSLPPAGSGECCEPKLLQYALTHGLKPTSMAMFWWGESPRKEVRHHLHFYPACNGKCKPLLNWMLQGIDVDANPLESKERDAMLVAKMKILYEDEDICVIDKPAGMLSVPGKNGRESVLGVMRKRYLGSTSPLVVHRLDMDTSGIMVIAKTMEAYHALQRQFAGHEVVKRYVAVLEKPITECCQRTAASKERSLRLGFEQNGGHTERELSLPLRPDLDDRPRQVVDFTHGRNAVTYYEKVGEQRVWLWPQTGRTHQLRVHCAHELGLGNPILGDPLYGTGILARHGRMPNRMYLHAEEISFRHPVTDRRMSFVSNAPF